MTDILVYTEEQGKVIAGSVQPDRMSVAVLGAVGGGTGGGGGAVSSVNGQIGHVVLDAADVGADPAGTGASAAAAAVAAHVGAADPHTQYTTVAEAAAAAPVQSVNGETGAVVLSATDVGADTAGAAAAAVAAHVADTTPHDVITQVDRFGFDTAAGLTAGVGEMVWNAADGTADLGLPGGVTLQVGQEGLIRVLNKTGGTIQNMHVVYITGAQGNRVTAAQAQANSVNADKTLAVATQDIANNAEGFATILGMVRQVNTSAWAEGTELWLSAATPGAITNVRPAAPNHQVRVGYVVRSHATEGVIYVTVNIGSDLSHLHDVVITAPADNDVLIYDSATQTWQNGPQTGGSGEVNTASNLGSGEGVFASKVGADLQFKSLVAGTGVTLTPTGTTITITASGAGGAVDSVNGQTGAVVLDTDDISEGVSNLYFTNARASAAAPVQSVNGQTGAVDLSGSYAPLSHVGSGGTAHSNVVAGGAAGFMTGADKTKLDGIAAGATANATDAQLRDRSTHTGTQAASTISDLTEAVQDIAGAAIVAGPGASVSYNDTTGQITVSATGVGLAAVVAYAGTGRDLALTDINTVIDCTSSSAVTITIPPQSSVAWTPDAEIHVRMSGAGLVSIAGGAGVTAPPITLPFALSAQGAVVTLKRRSADVWAVVGSGDDLLSTFVNAEVAIAGAVTLTASAFGKMHVCSGTSTDYAVGLPAVTGNAGRIIGLRMAPGLTKLVTVDASGAELIDGQQTRIMWANEVAVLLCNGSSWVKIAGKSVPMACGMYPSVASLTAALAPTLTLVPVAAIIFDRGGMSNAASNRIDIKRPGNYRVAANVYYKAGAGVSTELQCVINKNTSVGGVGAFSEWRSVPAAEPYRAVFIDDATFAAGDYVSLYGRVTTTARDVYTNDPTWTFLKISEEVSW